MDEFLYRISIAYSYCYTGKRNPVYAVAENKEAAREYVARHLEAGCKITKIVCCGKRLGLNMYHGLEDK